MKTYLIIVLLFLLVGCSKHQNSNPVTPESDCQVIDGELICDWTSGCVEGCIEDEKIGEENP